VLARWSLLYRGWGLALTLLAAVLVVLRPVVQALLPTSYAQGAAAWGPVLLGYLCQGQALLLLMRFTLQRRAVAAVLCQAVGAAVAVGLVPVLTVHWGLPGAALAGAGALAMTCLTAVGVQWGRGGLGWREAVVLPLGVVCLWPGG
jgi:hypothetical protein